MRGALSLIALAGLLLTPTAASAQSPSAESITVSATPITRFKGASIGEPVDGLIFKGGVELNADHPDFGGLSSLAFLDAGRFVMVSDEGRFLSGNLELTDGAPSGLSQVEIDVIRNSRGNPLPREFA